LAITIALMCGCHKGGPELAKVSGTVSLNGKPLTGGQITFFPAQGPSAFATIESDGTFVLSTKQPADGALIGTHKVAILPPTVGRTLESMTAAKAGRPSPSQITVPQYAQSPETSGITRDVARGENKFSIDLQQ
jgi:hypothetical protein